MFKKRKIISKRQEYRLAQKELDLERITSESGELSSGLSTDEVNLLKSVDVSNSNNISIGLDVNPTFPGNSVSQGHSTLDDSHQALDSNSDGSWMESSNLSSDNYSSSENNHSTKQDNNIKYSNDVLGVASSSEFLRNWSFENNITHKALSQLLTWFKTQQPDLSALPSCARTLLSTPPSITLQQHKNGLFYYFGLTETLEKIVLNSDNISKLSLSFGIDGIPLYKSSSISFWPILCKVVNVPFSSIFPVAIFSGPQKPDLYEFLQQFITELSHLQINGLSVKNQSVKISIHSFCCDYPARCFIKNTKGHNGYGGCDKCTDRGQSVKGRMLFLSLNAPKRTDSSFRGQNDMQHHKAGSTPLLSLQVDMVDKFPVDYMHSVCLGIVRKLLFLWRDGSTLYRIRGDKRLNLENYINCIKSYWPSEFSRKPRSLTYLERWKATELRQFLLYIGPVILKDLLPQSIYSNFLILHFALTILLNEKLNNKYNEFASNLLQVFVTHALKLYGKDFCIYNTHSLVHLAYDAKCFGSLNYINCFQFENYLQLLKKLIRKYSLPLQQVVKRLYEQQTHNFQKRTQPLPEELYCQKSIKDDKNGPLQYKKYPFFEELIFKGTKITKKEGNNIVFLQNGEVVKTSSFYQNEDEIIILGQKCEILDPVYLYPESSHVLNISEIGIPNMRDLKEYKATDILCKGITIPLSNKFMIFPFLHLL